MPKVSVILPVYNGEKYLEEAIESILNQTVKDFEFIIINDGSTDSSEEIILSYTDKRIKYFRHENIGLAATLNKGIELSEGIYIARQDQDDISLPKRLEKQITFMENNPSVGLLGAWAKIIDENNNKRGSHRHPTHDKLLKNFLLFNNPFVHSSVIIRKNVLMKTGFYTTNPDRQPPEDYELWSRISRVAEIANIPLELICYREVQTSMSREGEHPFSKKVRMISIENIRHYLSGSGYERFAEQIADAYISGQLSKVDNIDLKEALGYIANEIYGKSSEKFRIYSNSILDIISNHYIIQRFGLQIGSLLIYLRNKIFRKIRKMNAKLK